VSTDTVPPTLKMFIRHAERFGPECVAETAAAYLPPAEVGVLEAELALVGNRNGNRARARQRRSTPSLREQVLALRERGLVAAAIADTLNLSDRRVRELLNGSGHRENRAEKRLNQAEENAAKPEVHVLTCPTRIDGQIDIWEALSA